MAVDDGEACVAVGESEEAEVDEASTMSDRRTVWHAVSAVMTILAMCSEITASTLNTRGMTPTARSALERSLAPACAHNGRRLKIEQWNDGYCDCADGSDEPGTSGCAGQTTLASTTSFYCANSGYLSKRLAATYVDDGVCDCCDGSDEPLGRCTNVCADVGRAWRSDLQAKIATVKQGVQVRSQYVAEATVALAAARAELREVDGALQRATVAAEAALVVKKTWEVREKLAQRVLDARRAPPPAGPAPPAGSDDDIVLPDAADHDADHHPDDAPPADEDEDVLADVEDEKPAAPAAPAADELHDEMFEKGPQDDATLANYVARAEEARKAWQEAEDERNKQQTRQSELSATLKEDFGPDDAFYALKGKCYSFDTPEYRYELCPYGSVTQKPLSGHGGTSMGRWDGTGAGWVADSNHSQLDFKSGQGCWQGPDRSCRVFVSCGADNALSDTQEPNKCEYTMKFLTPAACTPATLEALEAQLRGDNAAASASKHEHHGHQHHKHDHHNHEHSEL